MSSHDRRIEMASRRLERDDLSWEEIYQVLDILEGRAPRVRLVYEELK